MNTVHNQAEEAHGMKCISLFFSHICAPGLRWLRRLGTGNGRFQQRTAFEIRLWFPANEEAVLCSVKLCSYLSLIYGYAYLRLFLHGPIYCNQQYQSPFVNQLTNLKQWSQNWKQVIIYPIGKSHYSSLY